MQFICLINKIIKIQISWLYFSMRLDLGLSLGLDHWSFIWFRAFFKVYAFQNSKLIKSLHKGMAETDTSHEFWGEPGVSSLVFSVFDPEGSHMLHVRYL